ncbi:discoidin domain-containing protein [Termitidicoccus mucosus]|uniref:discoidin domain-containing protein n=1 Tax=Termitidicoccus mucosus TaxID=1184151 RepID=UPI0009FF8669
MTRITSILPVLAGLLITSPSLSMARAADLPDDIGPNIAFGKTHKSSDINMSGWDGGLTDGVWSSAKGSTYATGKSGKFPKAVTIDLEGKSTIAYIHTGVPKIGFTKTIEASISEDGENFTTVGKHDFKMGTENRHLYAFKPAAARYIRLTFLENHPKPGKGGYPAAHCFVSEVEVYGPKGSGPASDE